MNASEMPTSATIAQATFARDVKNGVSNTATTVPMSQRSAMNGRSSNHPGMNGSPMAARVLSVVVIMTLQPRHRRARAEQPEQPLDRRLREYEEEHVRQDAEEDRHDRQRGEHADLAAVD